MKKKIGTDITKIVYSFGDSSVPPMYHRSYVITATPESISIVVDSYGTILADTSYSFDTEKFESLTARIKMDKLKNGKESKDSKGCTGGTTKSIKVFKGEEEIINGTNYYCGGEIFGNLKGDANSFAEQIKAFIPDLDKLRE
jgi:hypothetical protein